VRSEPNRLSCHAAREGRIIPATVRLTIIGGPDDGKQFVFRTPGRSDIGRGAGCYPRLPSDPFHLTVSRCHCLLQVAPPDVCVIDLGSRNGTYVNGVRVGGATSGEPPCPLHEGDELRVGETVFRVSVAASAEDDRTDGSGVTGQEALAH
jgi:pSer/pThr/pTyr-binding forkhead associated (FHA) protein